LVDQGSLELVLPDQTKHIFLMQRLADYVLGRVASAGVRHVFLVPGGAAMHLDDALAGRADLAFVANFHEHASAVGAEAYAKLTGNLGVALVTAGPGSTNCITGVTSAWVNSAPVLFLSGQVKRSDLKGTRRLRQSGLQEVDIVSIVRPITKYAATITDPLSVREHVDLALFHAKNGRPGPVWLDVPLDVQNAQVDPSALAPVALPATPASSPADLSERVERVIDRLRKASRPILLLGAGIQIGGAADLVGQAVERLGVPYTTTWIGADVLADEHPLFVGRAGSFAPRGANFAVQNSDVLLSIGARWDYATTGFSHSNFARGADRIVVDIDPAELEKLAPVVPFRIEANARDFLEELLRQLPRDWDVDRFASWRERTQDWRKRYPVTPPEVHPAADGRPTISTYVFVRALSRRLSPGDVLVQGSSGIHSEIFFMTFHVKTDQRIIADGSYGAMGYGLPASIGACLASGGRRTVLVDGDGSLMPNIQELETIRRLDLPIKIMVVNNEGYGSIRVSQMRWFNRLIAADKSSGLTLPGYRELATAFKLPYHVLDREDGLDDALGRILAEPGPAIVDVQVPTEEDRQPRLSNYQKADGTMASKPMEDLFPFLPRDEFLSNMIIPPLPE
jgi:acetolactate synthase-1/2/3 large subunit